MGDCALYYEGFKAFTNLFHYRTLPPCCANLLYQPALPTCFINLLHQPVYKPAEFWCVGPKGAVTTDLCKTNYTYILSAAKTGIQELANKNNR